MGVDGFDPHSDITHVEYVISVRVMFHQLFQLIHLRKPTLHRLAAFVCPEKAIHFCNGVNVWRQIYASGGRELRCAFRINDAISRVSAPKPCSRSFLSADRSFPASRAQWMEFKPIDLKASCKDVVPHLGIPRTSTNGAGFVQPNCVRSNEASMAVDDDLKERKG